MNTRSCEEMNSTEPGDDARAMAVTPVAGAVSAPQDRSAVTGAPVLPARSKAGMASVAKEQADSYYVRTADGWDYARIFIQGGQREPGHNWGYISVVSSFGSFGHVFSHIGTQSIESFLCGVEYGYLMNKLFGPESELFDPDETVKWYRTETRRARRNNAITAEQAREFFAVLDDVEANGHTSEGAFCCYMAEHGGKFFWDHLAMEGLRKRKNPQCVGFWMDIWPHFVRALRERVKEAA